MLLKRILANLSLIPLEIPTVGFFPFWSFQVLLCFLDILKFHDDWPQVISQDSHKSRWPLCVTWESPHKEGKKRPKRLAAPNWQVVGFNEQENSHTRLVLGGHKTRRRALPPTGVLRASLAPSPWFSHMDCPDGLNNTWLSQVCVLVLKWVQRCGWGGQHTLQGPGGDEEP